MGGAAMPPTSYTSTPYNNPPSGYPPPSTAYPPMPPAVPQSNQPRSIAQSPTAPFNTVRVRVTFQQ